MVNYKLLVLLEKVLGEGRATSGTNYAFFSPFCSHYKPKLEINLATMDGKNPWHCWISNEKGKTIHSLFKKLKVDRELFTELNKIVSDYKPSTKVELTIPKLELPNEFVALSSIKKSSLKNPTIKRALIYLKNRNISAVDIKRYNIGTCDSGEYKNMVIIPSYDGDGNLNYFVGRSILTDSFIKYKNPNVSKNIIPFELYINWKMPLILTEGVFDAIAAKINAIPLLGKTISPYLKEKIISERVQTIYIALDSDAIKDALKFIKYFLNQGLNVYLINLEGKDPSEIGTSEFLTQMESATLCSFDSLIKMELST
jgi:hypothetical protein